MITKLTHNLTFRVLVAMALGVALGVWAPLYAREMLFLSDIFIRLVKMVVAPIVLISIATGLGGMASMGQIGALGLRALIYFEVVTTIALAFGVLIALAIRPGAGFDMSSVVAGAPVTIPGLAGHTPAPAGFRAMILHMVPDSAVGVLVAGDMLPVLVFAVLFGLALSRTTKTSGPLIHSLERLGAVFFDIIGLVMVLSPVAAFGAMAFAVGQYGLGSLWALGKLLLVVYFAMVAFVTLVLGPICAWYKFSLLKLLKVISGEIALVFGTSSSESAMPGVMQRLTEVGCDKSVVGFVVPAGYSFNLDGTSLYLSTAVLFLAQAASVELSWEQIFGILGILLLTSKGAAGVTGAGFVTLAATLAALPGEPIPVESLVLLVGVDRFMSAARALTNLIGNSVATVVVAKSHGLFEDRGLL
jgi:aerobic C4-dicarboxylate transport protein